MSDVASLKQATCQSLDGAASATQSSCHGQHHKATLCKEGGFGEVGPPFYWPDGQAMGVEEEVCVESSSLRKSSSPFSDVGEWNRDRCHQDAAGHTLKVRHSLRPTPRKRWQAASQVPAQVVLVPEQGALNL